MSRTSAVLRPVSESRFRQVPQKDPFLSRAWLCESRFPMPLEHRLHARCGCASIGSAEHASGGRPFPLSSSTRHFERDRRFTIDHLLLDVALDVRARSIRATALLDVRRIDPGAEQLELDAIGFDVLAVTLDAEPTSWQYDGRALVVPVSSGISKARVGITYRATP